MDDGTRTDGRDGGRRPWLRLDRCEVAAEYDESARGHPVTIEGVNLRAAVAPPVITIGGQRLRDTTFAPDGRSLRGVVDEPPDGARVVVDYGFARAELDP